MGEGGERQDQQSEQGEAGNCLDDVQDEERHAAHGDTAQGSHADHDPQDAPYEDGASREGQVVDRLRQEDGLLDLVLAHDRDGIEEAGDQRPEDRHRDGEPQDPPQQTTGKSRVCGGREEGRVADNRGGPEPRGQRNPGNGICSRDRAGDHAGRDHRAQGRGEGNHRGQPCPEVSVNRTSAAAPAVPQRTSRTTRAAGSTSASNCTVPSAILLGRERTNGRAAAAAIPAAAKKSVGTSIPAARLIRCSPMTVCLLQESLL